MYDPRADDPSHPVKDDPNSLAELLQELRILLQGSQLLAGFLVVLPFSQRFADISRLEKGLYLGAFLATLTSLILFSAPAIHHRLQRPLANRIQFKNFATRMTVLGAIPLSLALPMAAHVASNEIAGPVVATIIALVIAAGIGFVWWLFPRLFPNRLPSHVASSAHARSATSIRST
jgi:hypothetical protein